MFNKLPSGIHSEIALFLPNSKMNFCASRGGLNALPVTKACWTEAQQMVMWLKAWSNSVRETFFKQKCGEPLAINCFILLKMKCLDVPLTKISHIWFCC